MFEPLEISPGKVVSWDAPLSEVNIQALMLETTRLVGIVPIELPTHPMSMYQLRCLIKEKLSA